MANSEPTKAAATCAQSGMPETCSSKNIIVIATNILAPDDMPSTKGPAIGFLKKVCSRKPDSDNAPPRIAAIHNRGRRIFHIILYSGVPESPFKNIILPICTGDI